MYDFVVVNWYCRAVKRWQQFDMGPPCSTYYSKNHNPKVSVLLTKPKDLDYEIFVLQRYRGFCQHLLNKKEAKNGKLEEDLILLKTNEINWMRRMSIVYRSEKKKILHTNIDLCNYLLTILASVKRKQNITIR